MSAFKQHIEPGDFTPHIDNPYMILRPGTTFVYADRGENSTDTMTVTHDTVVIDGVTCVAVHDTKTINGFKVEDTLDYFAQDKHGNVWYFGEDTKEFDPGNPVPVSTEGTWRAGVDGARPGIIMEADPHVGDRYLQENAPGVALDTARVLSLDSSVVTEYGIFDHVLKTKETTPLFPGDVEFKQYVAGVGEVLTTTRDGEYEQLVKIVVDGQSGNDTLLGYADNDVINGNAGSDILRGLDGNDRLNGGSGNDRLLAGQGNDILDGGSGNNSMTGGTGADTFVFHSLSNSFVETNTIGDYHKSQVDVIDLPNGVHSVASDELIQGVWQLTLAGDADVIRLLGVTDANHNGHIIDDLLIL